VAGVGIPYEKGGGGEGEGVCVCTHTDTHTHTDSSVLTESNVSFITLS